MGFCRSFRRAYPKYPPGFLSTYPGIQTLFATAVQWQHNWPRECQCRLCSKWYVDGNKVMHYHLNAESAVELSIRVPWKVGELIQFGNFVDRRGKLCIVRVLWLLFIFDEKNENTHSVHVITKYWNGNGSRCSGGGTDQKLHKPSTCTTDNNSNNDLFI